MPVPSGRRARYIVVGVVCAGFHNIIMIVGDFTGAHFVALNLLSFTMVTPVGYWLHTGFTFAEKRTLGSFLKFASGVAAGFPISVLLTAIFFSAFSAPMTIAAPLTTALLFVWNYCSAQWAILSAGDRRL